MTDQPNPASIDPTIHNPRTVTVEATALATDGTAVPIKLDLTYTHDQGFYAALALRDFMNDELGPALLERMHTEHGDASVRQASIDVLNAEIHNTPENGETNDR